MEKIETNVIKPEMSFFENDRNYQIMDSNEEMILDNRIKDIENYISNNSGKNKTDEEKDNLYKNSQELWYSFMQSLKDAKYNFHLNREQYNFLTNLILTKLEYDVNTVFFAIELTDMLGSMKNAKYTDSEQIISFPVNATEITYIYHLISKHTVKGLTKDSYTFSKILLRIGAISKAFNYYETASKNLSSDIQDWTMSFEVGVEVEKKVKPVTKTKVEKVKLEPKSEVKDQFDGL